jgi:hypothetical protein
VGYVGFGGGIRGKVCRKCRARSKYYASDAQYVGLDV